MDTSLIIKLLAAGITLFYIQGNEDKKVNYLGFSFVFAIVLFAWGVKVLTTIGFIVYILTIGISLIWTISNKIEIPKKSLLIVFLVCSLITLIPKILFLPEHGILFYLGFVVIALYLYFQFRLQNRNVLILTSIPVIDSILSVFDLINYYLR